MPKRRVPHNAYLLEQPRDADVAAVFIQDASKESPEAFRQALRQVAEAHRMSKVASAAGLQRESLYRMLCREGNPRHDSLCSVLEAMGLRLTVEPICPPSPPGSPSRSHARPKAKDTGTGPNHR